MPKSNIVQHNHHTLRGFESMTMIHNVGFRVCVDVGYYAYLGKPREGRSLQRMEG